MDTRLRNLLHDLASDMPVELERSARPTLRKARRRRAVGAGGAVVAVVAFVAVGVSALRLVEEPTAPATTGPNPATFAGLWPETDQGSLAETQAAVNEGDMPLRTTPEGTATLLATNLFGWNLSNVRTQVSQERGEHAVVLISNAAFSDNIPPIVVGLRQLGQTGPNGVWSVLEASNLLLDPIGGDGTSGIVHVSGEVPDVYDSAPAIEAVVFDGPTLEPSLGEAAYELVDRTFELDVVVAPTPDGRATLLIRMPDATGASIGAAMQSVETPVGEAAPSVPNLTGLPPDVAATAQRIYDAAQTGDVDALGELLDPDTFVYNLDDGSDPTEAWRANPSELDLMVAILEMPPTSRDIGPGYGTFYFWPYLVNADLEALTPEERADLASLGYSEQEIQLMIDGGTGYQGPRLAIDENGEWRNFITVGE